MKAIVFLTAGLFLSACANQEIHKSKYDESLKSWAGKSERDLVMEWGTPSDTYSLGDGSKMVTFSRSTGRSLAVKRGGVSETQNYCKTSFLLSSAGVVTSTKSEGNSCRVAYKKPGNSVTDY